jgi:bifunctional non-homologous end joining protein LigD
VIKRSAFLPIASPRLVKEPPTGPDWLHEVKFDGFRLQAHKLGAEVRLFSRNGKDFTDRYPSVVAAVLHLGTKSAVIDGELVSCDPEDRPDFYALMRRRTSGLCVWCFDLLTLNGQDLRPVALEQRKAKLEVLLRKTDDNTLRLSHTFADGEKLLHAASQNGLEGIVSKRRMARYVAGSASGWIKVKTDEWRAANRERYKLFEKALNCGLPDPLPNSAFARVAIKVGTSPDVSGRGQKLTPNGMDGVRKV